MLAPDQPAFDPDAYRRESSSGIREIVAAMSGVSGPADDGGEEEEAPDWNPDPLGQVEFRLNELD